jgi:competence protein ComEC
VVSAGEQFQFGQVEAELLWPPKWVGEVNQSLANDTSLVVRLSCAGRRVLLTGDISDIAVRRLLDGVAGGELDLRADVLVFPHHGAITKLTDEFVRAVDPSLVIISSRRAGSEITPRSSELSRPSRAVFVTGDCGAVTVHIDPAGHVTCSPTITPAK